MIYYRGLKFPHIAVVLLVLESDGACTGLNGHSARKICVGFSMLLQIENKVCRGTKPVKAV